MFGDWTWSGSEEVEYVKSLWHMDGQMPDIFLSENLTGTSVWKQITQLENWPIRTRYPVKCKVLHNYHVIFQWFEIQVGWSVSFKLIN
jgi:hypothetical protein